MRLEAVAERMGDAVSVEWRTFLLRPEPEHRDPERFARYTLSWTRPNSVEPSITFNPWFVESGSGEPQPVADPPPSSSVEPHIASNLIKADQPEHWDRFHLGLMKAYFTDHRDISNPEVQVEVAASIGADGAALANAIVERGEVTAAEIRAEYATAVQQGITAAPTVVLNNQLPIAGAQDVEAYVAWISRILQNLNG